MAANDCTVTDHSAPEPDLGRKLRQLVAATVAISGGGFEMFNLMGDNLKDDYLCMLADIAAEALQQHLAKALAPRLIAEVSHG
jgi:hypothetical protein